MDIKIRCESALFDHPKNKPAESNINGLATFLLFAEISINTKRRAVQAREEPLPECDDDYDDHDGVKANQTTPPTPSAVPPRSPC